MWKIIETEINMLSIQPKISTSFKPAFKAYQENEDYSSISLAEMDEDSYESIKNDLREQKNDFLDLANGKEFKFPKPAKKILEGGAVLTTGLLGGMATGWGAKKSIQACSKLAKSSPLKNLTNYIKDADKFVKISLSTIKKQFLASDVYIKPSKKISRQYNKFAKTKIGKPVATFLEGFKDGLKTIYKDIRKGLEYIWNKIKGVKKSTYEKAVVNTVGTSGGIASGVTALKETQEKNQRLNDYYDGEE